LQGGRRSRLEPQENFEVFEKKMEQEASTRETHRQPEFRAVELTRRQSNNILLIDNPYPELSERKATHERAKSATGFGMTTPTGTMTEMTTLPTHTTQGLPTHSRLIIKYNEAPKPHPFLSGGRRWNGLSEHRRGVSASNEAKSAQSSATVQPFHAVQNPLVASFGIASAIPIVSICRKGDNEQRTRSTSESASRFRGNTTRVPVLSGVKEHTKDVLPGMTSSRRAEIHAELEAYMENLSLRIQTALGNRPKDPA
jgi:hypothetical protein